MIQLQQRRCVVAVLVVFCLGPASYGDQMTMVMGASPEETAQLNEAQISERTDDPEKLDAMYTTILEVHPENRPARWLRANLRAQLGYPDRALEDLTTLKARDARFPGVTETAALIARITGNAEAELAAYASMPATDLDFPAKLRVAELRGQTAQANELYRGELRAGTEFAQVMCNLAWGAYLQRAGNDGDAKKAFQTAIDKARAPMQAPLKRDAQISLALSTWASGDRSNALKIVVDLIETFQDERSYRTVSTEAALITQILSVSGADNDARIAAAKALQSVRDTSLLSRTGVLGAVWTVPTKHNQEEIATAIEGILSRAPRHEAALKGAMYLILVDPRYSDRLVKLLPEDSLYRRIVSVEAASRQR